MLHLGGVGLQPIEHPLHLAEHVVQSNEAVGQGNALGAGMADVALVPQGNVVECHLGVGLHHARKTAHAFGGNGVALMGHCRRALLTLGERLFRLDDVRLLQQTHLHGNGLQGGGGNGKGGHYLGMAVAGQNLGRKRVGSKAELFADVLLNEWVYARVRSHGTADSAGGSNLAGFLQARLSALERPSPAAELHAKGHGLCMDAMGTANAQGLLELEGTAFAGFTELLHVIQNDVHSLGDLVGKGRVSQVGRSHAVMNPAARRLLALRNIGVDVLGHVGGEGDDIVVRYLLDLVDALNREVGMCTDPSGLFLGYARFTQLSLCLAGQDLNLFPDLELVLQLPDGAHLGARVATDHPVPPLSQALRRAFRVDWYSTNTIGSLPNGEPTTIARFRVPGSTDRYRRQRSPGHRGKCAFRCPQPPCHRRAIPR